MRELFVAELVDLYLASHPQEAGGNVGVDMVRLEVDALRP
jgi:hypothetical protein